MARGPGRWTGGRGGQLRPAMTPPSTSQMAPVTRLVAGKSRNAMVLARSRAVLVQPSGWMSAICPSAPPEIPWLALASQVLTAAEVGGCVPWLLCFSAVRSGCLSRRRMAATRVIHGGFLTKVSRANGTLRDIGSDTRTLAAKGIRSTLWYAGKTHDFGGNIQALLYPSGILLRISDVRPG